MRLNRIKLFFQMRFKWMNGLLLAAVAAGVVLAVLPEREQEYHVSWTMHERQSLALVRDYYVKEYEVLLEREVLFSDGEKGWFDVPWLKPAMKVWCEARNSRHAWQVFGPRLALIDEVLRTGDAARSNECGESLLHLALGLGEYDLARVLVERGAQVNGRMAAVSEWMVHPEGDTPLTLAMHPYTFCGQSKHPVEDQVGMVRFLLDHGADVNGRSVAGYRPLYMAMMWAVRFPEYMQVVDLLLEQAPELNDLGGEPRVTALGAAVAMGRLELVEKLCGMGADVKVPSNGRPVLLWVSPRCRDSLDIARFLLDRGVEADANFELFEEGPELEDVPVRRSLLLYLCESLPAQLSGEAAGAGKVSVGARMQEVAKLLLDRGASADFPNVLSGETPLMACCRHVARAKDGLSRELAMDMARLLLAHGASPNARKHGDGDSVLAFYAGLFREGRMPDATDVRMVKLLADAGAVARFGRLPYGHARMLRQQWNALSPELRTKLPEVFPHKVPPGKQAM